MARALEWALTKHNLDFFQSITYVGDGFWDLMASRSLNYNFIGIAAGADAAKLKNQGAIHVLEDLSDQKRFYQLLEPVAKSKRD